MKIKKKIKEILNIPSFIKLINNPIVNNKDVFILGSAPNPNLELYTKDKLLITCNGSAASAHQNNLNTPVMTVIDNELVDLDIASTKPSRNKIINNKLLKGLNLGHLVSVQSNFSKGGSPEILGAKYKKFEQININLRRMILSRALDLKWLEMDELSLASTGGFTIALCAFLNARSITFEGFNLFQGESNDLKHFYESDKYLPSTSKKLNTKAHSLADSLVIGLLVARGKKLFSSEVDFSPLLSNWGNPIFKYKER